ncbi:hypothetical protein BKA70DRAFT_1241766 [Coprinopsis sp. MPI-PUGE-AT-0042]|nr:hypothetical protein BKA70DRAFT_1241766 [Coprinopsis sp. MPI-PUGE-AT-0042]
MDHPKEPAKSLPYLNANTSPIGNSERLGRQDGEKEKVIRSLEYAVVHPRQDTSYQQGLRGKMMPWRSRGAVLKRPEVSSMLESEIFSHFALWGRPATTPTMTNAIHEATVYIASPCKREKQERDERSSLQSGRYLSAIRVTFLSDARQVATAAAAGWLKVVVIRVAIELVSAVFLPAMPPDRKCNRCDVVKPLMGAYFRPKPGANFNLECLTCASTRSEQRKKNRVAKKADKENVNPSDSHGNMALALANQSLGTRVDEGGGEEQSEKDDEEINDINEASVVSLKVLLATVEKAGDEEELDRITAHVNLGGCKGTSPREKADKVASGLSEALKYNFKYHSKYKSPRYLTSTVFLKDQFLKTGALAVEEISKAEERVLKALACSNFRRLKGVQNQAIHFHAHRGPQENEENSGQTSVLYSNVSAPEAPIARKSKMK